jgi:myosin-5
MDDTVGALGKGSRVWYRQDAATWALAEICDTGASEGAVSIALLTGPAAGSVLEGLQDGGGLLVPANPALQQGIADLTQLSFLNEPSILDNLSQRYGVDAIYTNAGPVLIAVNPCRQLPLYTPEVAAQYKGASAAA